MCIYYAYYVRLCRKQINLILIIPFNINSRCKMHGCIGFYELSLTGKYSKVMLDFTS